jgi:hypothetical protein
MTTAWLASAATGRPLQVHSLQFSLSQSDHGGGEGRKYASPPANIPKAANMCAQSLQSQPKSCRTTRRALHPRSSPFAFALHSNRRFPYVMGSVLTQPRRNAFAGMWDILRCYFSWKGGEDEAPENLISASADLPCGESN